jgi:hypothetical protein
MMSSLVVRSDESIDEVRLARSYIEVDGDETRLRCDDRIVQYVMNTDNEI